MGKTTGILWTKEISDDYLADVWRVMLSGNHHTYQILTKRPHIARERIQRLGLDLAPHIWLGVSVENQRFAENRIPVLIDIGAAVSFLSCEPLLGPVHLGEWIRRLQWVITGGESGRGRRSADWRWFAGIRNECIAAGVPFFHKQGNADRPDHDRLIDGREWNEYPVQRTGQGVLIP